MGKKCTRRQFLRSAVMAAGLAVAAPLLSACAPAVSGSGLEQKVFAPGIVVDGETVVSSPSADIVDLCGYYDYVTKAELNAPANANKLVIPLAKCGDLESTLKFYSHKTVLEDGTVVPLSSVFFDAKEGAELIAPFDGEVSYIEFMLMPGGTENNGLVIEVESPNRLLFSCMLYKGRMVKGLGSGQVKRGQVIGYVGEPFPDIGAYNRLIVARVGRSADFWISNGETGGDLDLSEPGYSVGGRFKFLPQEMVIR